MIRDRDRGKSCQAARDTGQFETLSPNPEWPHWGRDELDHEHAIYAIAAHLRSLGLERWTARLVRWLSNYDGLERWVEEGKAPAIEVRDLLAVYVSEFGSMTALPQADLGALKRAITDELLQLEFLRYRAYWGRGLVHDADARVWQPLATPWLSFVDASRPGEELMVFFAADGIEPPPAAHRRFLLQE